MTTLSSQLEREFFPFVIKPGRYAGGELHSRADRPTTAVRFCHAWPDRYEIGQSSATISTLYRLVNQEADCVGERVFAVDRDAEKRLRELDLPLFTIDSHTPVRDFDLVGFTVTNPGTYANIPAMLDLARIPIRAADRSDSDPIVILGGPAVAAAEAILPWFDAVILGDAEPVLVNALRAASQQQGTRAERLSRVGALEGVWLPTDKGHQSHPVWLDDFAAAPVSVPLVPLVEVFSSAVPVEAVRGAQNGCGCADAAAPMLQRPSVFRSAFDLGQQVGQVAIESGCDAVAVVTVPDGDVDTLERQILSLVRNLTAPHTAVYLPPLDPMLITNRILDALGRLRRTGLTLAVAAASEERRAAIGSSLPDRAILEACRMIFAAGWRSLTIRVTIGWPGENDRDLEALAMLMTECVKTAKSAVSGAHLTIGLVPFSPQPASPWQWDECPRFDVLQQRAARLRKRLRGTNAHVNLHADERHDYLAPLLRGTRETAAVIEAAARRGARFDNELSDFDPARWDGAWLETGRDRDAEFAARPFSEPIAPAPLATPEALVAWQAARRQTAEIAADYRPPSIETKPSVEATVQYGRSKRKVSDKNTAAPTRNRIRLRLARGPRFRFMSHLDMARLIERLIRAGRLPIAWSQGKTPTMKVALGPPLPLGFTSAAEYVDLTLAENAGPTLLDDLTAVLPDDLSLVDSAIVLGASVSLSALINRARYTMPVANYCADTAGIAGMIEQLLSSRELVISRDTKSGTREVDVRPFIHALAIDAGTVTMTLGLGEGGYVRPIEVLTFLEAHLDRPAVAIALHRTDLWQETPDGYRREPMTL